MPTQRGAPETVGCLVDEKEAELEGFREADVLELSPALRVDLLAGTRSPGPLQARSRPQTTMQEERTFGSPSVEDDLAEMDVDPEAATAGVPSVA